MKERGIARLALAFCLLSVVPAHGQEDETQSEVWPEIDAYFRLSSAMKLFGLAAFSSARKESYSEGQYGIHWDISWKARRQLLLHRLTNLANDEKLAKETLPDGFAYEWTTLAFQQNRAGNTAMFAFGLAVVFVFLVLAAQFESLTLPLAVILIVPMCLVASIVGVVLRGQDNNILTQVGFVVLVGLAAKNAILIVEFARELKAEGMSPVEAAVEATRRRAPTRGRGPCARSGRCLGRRP
jgi:hypothetical protein